MNRIAAGITLLLFGIWLLWSRIRAYFESGEQPVVEDFVDYVRDRACAFTAALFLLGIGVDVLLSRIP